MLKDGFCFPSLHFQVQCPIEPAATKVVGLLSGVHRKVHQLSLLAQLLQGLVVDVPEDGGADLGFNNGVIFAPDVHLNTEVVQDLLRTKEHVHGQPGLVALKLL